MSEFKGFNDNDLGVWNNGAIFNDKVKAYLQRLKPILEKRKYALYLLTLKPTRTGRYIASFNGKLLKTDIFVGFSLLPSDTNQVRTYCVLQVKCRTEEIADKVKEACADLKYLEKNKKEVILVEPLASIIALTNQEDQTKKLDAFFRDGLEKLEEAGVIELMCK